MPLLFASSALAREVWVEATLQDLTTCELSVGLDLGSAGRLAARRPGALEAMASAWLGAGDPSTRDGLLVEWDGRFLSLRKVGPCEEAVTDLGALLERVDHTRELSVPDPVVRAWLPPPELVSLRGKEALHRAIAAALGASETAASDEEVYELLVDAMREAPIAVRTRGRLTREVIARRLPRRMKAIAPATPRTLAPFEPRTLLLPPQAVSMSRFWVLWRVDDRDDGVLLESLLGHRGHRLAERLVNDWGLVDELGAVWLQGPSLIVISGAVAGGGFKAPIERLFIELTELSMALSKRPASEEASTRGAWLLASARRGFSLLHRAAPRSPQHIARLLDDTLTRDLATVVVEPMRDDPETAVAVVDAELIATWTAATLDLRCPSPDDRRDKSALLEEEHGLDAKRYLAMSRALGRDSERMRLLDRELVDRCAEDMKLRAMLSSPRIIAMHREIRCGKAATLRTDDATEVARRRKVYRRYGIDSSVHRPLIAMARRSPTLLDELLAIDQRCPEVL